MAEDGIETMIIETIAQHTRLGVELVDALTGAAIVGDAKVSVTNAGGAAQVVRAAGARWIVESPVGPTAVLAIRSNYYVPDVRAVSAAPSGGSSSLMRVRLLPRTGYPFPTNLTRIVGRVVFDGDSRVVANAQVLVQPQHTTSGTEPARATRTTDDGQYTMWFDALPLTVAQPPLADEVAVKVTATVAGSSFSGSLPAMSLAANHISYAPMIRLVPSP